MITEQPRQIHVVKRDNEVHDYLVVSIVLAIICCCVSIPTLLCTVPAIGFAAAVSEAHTPHNMLVHATAPIYIPSYVYKLLRDIYLTNHSFHAQVASYSLRQFIHKICLATSLESLMGEKFGEFDGSSAICQTKNIRISNIGFRLNRFIHKLSSPNDQKYKFTKVFPAKPVSHCYIVYL